MVNVGDKPVTERVCVARAQVRMAPETREAILEGRMPKGDVFATARLAGIQATGFGSGCAAAASSQNPRFLTAAPDSAS